MKKIFLLLCAMALVCFVHGQNTSRLAVKDASNKTPIAGATIIVNPGNRIFGADSLGTLALALPNGDFLVKVSYVGYEAELLNIKLPQTDTATIIILLKPDNQELEGVVVTATRSSRTIEDIASRVETISGEELDEKANMKPGDIRMLLSESTGIQTQQTSATSGNASIRIQGLDGKYTQVLKDGLPLYAGFSGGLSLLQTPPLDLQQVEVIKGASSTLYGGGAIAGLVNLVSKTPKQKPELSLLLNGTSALGVDASGFYAKKFKKLGTTIFASYNYGHPYDPAKIGLSAIPKFNRYTLNPRLFVYFDENTTLNFGVNTVVERRLGGSMSYLNGQNADGSPYFERNRTNRVSTQLAFQRHFANKGVLNVKNGNSIYDRHIGLADYGFSGVQLSTFSEVNYLYETARMDWVAGVNFSTDRFNQHRNGNATAVDYDYQSVGAFFQNTWRPTDKFSLETGFRTDYQNKFGFFPLPRISALLKISPKVAVRLGGGMGYKSPTVFTEDAERIQFRGVLPINLSQAKAEKSIGANFDVNYKTPLTENLFLTLNTLLFYTQVKNPLVLQSVGNSLFAFSQPYGYVDTKGAEVNAKFSLQPFKLFVGYTLAAVDQHQNGAVSALPLVAKHRLNNVLMYEVEDKWKLGLEAYYFSKQKLNDGAMGKPYWITGFMAEHFWERFSVFINFENFFDTRQTHFDTIYTGSVGNPQFRDIYAPVDGFVVNGGVKLKF